MHQQRSAILDELAIPEPAHPEQRRQPLPWHHPKPPQEDPDAWRRIESILQSPSYRLAEQDADLLGRDEARGLRLQLEYLKPELLLEAHGIDHTIVVFGGTRICEPTAAQRRLEAARQAQAADPSNRGLARACAIAGRVAANSRYYEIAREFGHLVAAASQQTGSRLVVMTGGGPGIMEAANRGAFDVGAQSLGLNITLPHEQFPNPYVTPDLCLRFHYFALRKLHFVMRAKALVAFPGGYGTFDELFEVLTLVQTRKIKPLPIVLIGESYWRRAVDFDYLVDEGVIDPEDRELLWFAETASDAWKGILAWHEACATPLGQLPGRDA
jgi:uncharacterized protein (TIGR00730 family)